MKNNLLSILAEQVKQNQDTAMVTITGVEGSSPRGVGTMMLIDKNGNILSGTIGGGAVEEAAKRDAVECIKRGIPQSFRYNMDKNAEGANTLNMTCGGNIDVFINIFMSKAKLLIIGGGHIGFNIYKLGKMLGYYVVIIDERIEFSNRERFSEADEVLTGDIAANMENYPIDENTNVVIVTHGHKFDEQALEKVINRPAGYVGMIGSRKKIEICFNNLENKGIERKKLNAVYSPIGLDIGGDRPEEIALAIMAEIQAVRYGRNGGFLKNNKL